MKTLKLIRNSDNAEKMYEEIYEMKQVSKMYLYSGY